VIRQREVAELKALEVLTRARTLVDSQAEKREALRRQRRRAQDAGTAGPGGAEVVLSGSEVLRQRSFAETLRRLEELGEHELSLRAAELADYRELYGQARARRRILETLRDRRERQQTEKDGRALERTEAGRPSAAVSAEWPGAEVSEDTTR
jgi:hypothetical protein